MSDFRERAKSKAKLTGKFEHQGWVVAYESGYIDAAEYEGPQRAIEELERLTKNKTHLALSMGGEYEGSFIPVEAIQEAILRIRGEVRGE